MSSGYSLIQFGDMITDSIRMDAYTNALKQAIRPGTTVLDIGSGPGTTAMLCVQLGAEHVFAIDPDPTIRLAKRAIELNGMTEQITVIEGVSQDFQPDRQVDVIVSDLRDRLPLNGPSLPSIIDARDRLLAPGGVLLPQRDMLFVAPVDNATLYENIVGPWHTERYGLDMSPVVEKVVNVHVMQTNTPDQFVGPATQWAEIDYRNITGPDVSGDVSWTAESDRTVHGLEVWFDTEIGFGCGYSNAPGKQSLIYGSEFFPLERPMPLQPGDQFRCEIHAKQLKGGYVWRWRTSHRRNGKVLTLLDQSDFGASLDDPRPTLLRQLPDHRPQLSDEAKATHLALDVFSKGGTVSEAAAAIDGAGFDRFQGPGAVDLAKSLSARFSVL